MKLSLVAVALLVASGVSLATNAKKPMDTLCSGGPNGTGGIAPIANFACGVPGGFVCCYRIPDNLIITRAY